MRPFHGSWTGALLGPLVLVIVFGACGGTDDSGQSIVIDGSSTVAPITEAVGEEFHNEQEGIQVSVGTSGTGGGFKKFCAGEIDIADASRPIKDEEKQACKSNGIEYIEFRVGLDGLVVVTSAKNRFLECLSLQQLAEIFKRGGARTWDQIDPRFPREKVAIFAPGTDSGTYDFFVEEVLGDPKKPESLEPRTDYTASEDDNTLVQGIEGERNSWGYFGFAYFNENKEKLKALKVSGDHGKCVPPTDETIEAGSYPLSRPLFIYVKKSALARPVIQKFVRFYLEITPALISQVGYTPAPREDYEKGLDILASVSSARAGQGPRKAGL